MSTLGAIGLKIAKIGHSDFWPLHWKGAFLSCFVAVRGLCSLYIVHAWKCTYIVRMYMYVYTCNTHCSVFTNLCVSLGCVSGLSECFYMYEFIGLMPNSVNCVHSHCRPPDYLWVLSYIVCLAIYILQAYSMYIVCSSNVNKLWVHMCIVFRYLYMPTVHL